MFILNLNTSHAKYIGQSKHSPVLFNLIDTAIKATCKYVPFFSNCTQMNVRYCIICSVNSTCLATLQHISRGIIQNWIKDMKQSRNFIFKICFFNDKDQTITCNHWPSALLPGNNRILQYYTSNGENSTGQLE